jgi:hypothetical protein
VVRRVPVPLSSAAVGLLDQFIKDTFAFETPTVTHGAAVWQLPPELGMSEVRLDGLLRIVDGAALQSLAAPWCLVIHADELVLEAKMLGDHLDLPSFDRACLRRVARQVYRQEDPDDPFDGETPLWFVASHVSAVIRARRPVTEVAEGCYRIGPEWMSTFWIAANELPLADELVPFLVARTGRRLDEFLSWVKTRRGLPWLARVLELLPMSTAAYDDLHAFWLRKLEKTDDPAIRARRDMLLGWMLEARPEWGKQIEERGEERGVEKGKLEEARKVLRRVLKLRGLVLGADDEARVEACTDLGTIERWHDQALSAASAAEALR